jgi:hypothetical protein
MASPSELLTCLHLDDNEKCIRNTGRKRSLVWARGRMRSNGRELVMGDQNAVTFTRSYPAVSEADVQRYEERLGVQFPDDYRSFLLVTNGGMPAPHHFVVPDENHVLYVSFLYAIKNEHAISDLVYELEDLASRMTGKLPDGFIVIGRDPGDSNFLLGTRGDHAGQVWFWDTERQVRGTNPTANTYWLADSFADFLNGLRA